MHSTDRRIGAVVLGVLGAMFVGVLGCALGDHVGFPILHLMPVCTAAWWGGMWPGACASMSAAIVWFVVNREDLSTLVGPSAPYRVASVRLLFFLAAAAVMARLQRALKDEKYLARTDRLTGVYNRVALREFATRDMEACRRHGYPLSVQFIDVDNMKRLNDEYGHSEGDHVLEGIGDLWGAARVSQATLAGRAALIGKASAHPHFLFPPPCAPCPESV